MDNTTSDDLPMMKRVVEDYIYQRTGKRIAIVFDDVMQIRRHFQMLTAAFDIVQVQQNKNK
jgi:hypothetical protein